MRRIPPGGRSIKGISLGKDAKSMELAWRHWMVPGMRDTLRRIPASRN